MSEGKLRQTTVTLLADPLLGEGDLDSKILGLLTSEYSRRLADCRAVNERLAHKYQTTFTDFLDRRTTVQHESSWEVEKDALDWERAIAGMTTAESKLKAIEEVPHAPAQ